MGLNLSNWLEESGKDFIYSKKQQVKSDLIKMTAEYKKKKGKKKAAAYSLP